MTARELIARCRAIGLTSAEAALAAKRAGIGTIDTVKELRAEYGLELPAAKEALAWADGYESLDERQEALLEALQKAYADEDYEP